MESHCNPRHNAALASAPILIVVALAALALAACGPTYPECDNDEHCASHNQHCLDNLCRDCRVDAHCNAVDPCMECGSGYTCERRQGCCKTDLDCPEGRCWKTGSAMTGTCGGNCQEASHCPPGQRCSGGNCVPDVACAGDGDCPSGQKCKGGTCVTSSCEVVPIQFDFNEFTIRLDQESTINANASCLTELATHHSVEGHCDDRGSDEYNLALGQRRAAAVARQYKSLGVPASQISTLSYGEEQPACTDSSESCWSQNRRVETVPR